MHPPHALGPPQSCSDCEAGQDDRILAVVWISSTNRNFPDNLRQPGRLQYQISARSDHNQLHHRLNEKATTQKPFWFKSWAPEVFSKKARLRSYEVALGLQFIPTFLLLRQGSPTFLKLRATSWYRFMRRATSLMHTLLK